MVMRGRRIRGRGRVCDQSSFRKELLVAGNSVC